MSRLKYFSRSAVRVLAALAVVLSAWASARASTPTLHELREYPGVTQYITLSEAMLKSARSALKVPFGAVSPQSLKHLLVVELEGNTETRGVAAAAVRAAAKAEGMERIYEANTPDASHVLFGRMRKGGGYEAVIIWVSDDTSTSGRVTIMQCEGLIPANAFNLDLNFSN